MTPVHPAPAMCGDVLPECSRRFASCEGRLDRLEDEQRLQGKDLAAIGAKLTVYAAVGGIGGGVVTGLIVAAITHAWR